MQPTWRPVLAGEARERVLAVARTVAEKLRIPDAVERVATDAAARSLYPELVHWRPVSVSNGDAGMAMAAAYLSACFPGAGWDKIGHLYLTRAKRGAEAQQQHPPGLFSGLSGLAFAAAQLRGPDSRYQRFLDALDAWLAPHAEAAAQALETASAAVPVSRFDAISGLSGVAAYLLCRRDTPGPRAALERVLQALASLARDPGERPRWFTPAELLSAEERKHYPRGNLNCGLAHGIPGPLAVLALARRAGVDVPGQVDAIEHMAAWLVAQRFDDEWGVNWPGAVEPADGDAATRRVPSRAGWCYGSPGLARALWHAGVAIDRADYRDQAVTAMHAVFRRPVAARHVDSPTFCHGVSGLLQITLRFAHDTGDAALAQGAAALVEQVLAAYAPERPLGFASLEHDGRLVDAPGILDGSSGIVLVLLAAATDRPPDWDRLFLLS